MIREAPNDWVALDDLNPTTQDALMTSRGSDLQTGGMMWPRVDNMRSLELGSAGKMRSWLNSLVLSGHKKATAGRLEEYEQEGEPLEQVGERLSLLDDHGVRIATVEVTQVDTWPFMDVPWEFAAAEGEGDNNIEEWREGHRRFWAAAGTPVDDDTIIVGVRFEVVEVL